MGKTWFIPHHGVYHPHKPGKILVVFDCSARYKGRSLDDKLLRGPDLTNFHLSSQEDVDRWPHLNGVYLPTVNAEIGLLIASDVPEALDPLEVKNSQHGGPCATRTRLGSMVL